MLFYTQYTCCTEKITVNNRIGKCLTYSCNLWGVFNTLNAIFQAEWTWHIQCQLRKYRSKELKEIVLPTPIVCETVFVPFLSYKIAHVYIIHTEITKTLTY